MTPPDYRRQPVFILTSDLDWAPEAAIEVFLAAVAAAGIVPTLFVTHDSPAARQAFAEGRAEPGIHPNFLPHSTHGGDVASVMDHIFALVPGARAWRSHSFVDSTPISNAMARRGIWFDSNLCLYLQSDLFPLERQSGILGFPVFWEDDVHWSRGGGWSFAAFADRFFSPGLKVINIHPLNFALNLPSQEVYDAVKRQAPQDAAAIARLAHGGVGTASFAAEMFASVRRHGFSFTTLAALYRLHRPEDMP